MNFLLFPALKDVDAMFNLALCYENGWGVEVDMVEAFKLYTMASDAGSLHATYSLAEIHQHGNEGQPVIFISTFCFLFVLGLKRKKK